MNDHVRFKSHESSYRRTRKKIETPNRIALVIEIVRRTGLMLGTKELGELVRRTVSELTRPVPFFCDYAQNSWPYYGNLDRPLLLKEMRLMAEI